MQKISFLHVRNIIYWECERRHSNDRNRQIITGRRQLQVKIITEHHNVAIKISSLLIIITNTTRERAGIIHCYKASVYATLYSERQCIPSTKREWVSEYTTVLFHFLLWLKTVTRDMHYLLSTSTNISAYTKQ